MKRTLLLAVTILFALSCGKDSSSGPSSGGGCNYNGHALYRGPQGGCYYINSSGNKEYVERSYCDCL